MEAVVKNDDIALLSPAEREVKQVIELFTATLYSTDDATLLKISETLKREGMAISEPGIRHRKFIAAALLAAYHPIRASFHKI
jgi:hypothetical protein